MTALRIALATLGLCVAFVAARCLCQKMLQPGHLWRSAYGNEVYFGKWRYCYRCQEWAKPWTKCGGSKVSCCGSGRS